MKKSGWALLGLSLLFVVSCGDKKGAGPVEQIDLFVGSKQITDVLVDADPIRLESNESRAYPLKLSQGTHAIQWQIGGQKKIASFSVGPGSGSITIARVAPVVSGEGSVKIVKAPN